MKINAFKKLLADDYSDAPKGSWLTKLIQNLNLFIDQTTTALRNNITFEENFRCKAISISIVSDEPVFVSADKPTGVMVMQLEPGVMLLGFSWQPKNQGVEVVVKHSKSSAATCKLLILQ